MSSTTIIYKAYDDLGLRSKNFAGEVLSVLILEDILGILLMVILSATAVSQQFQGGELARSLISLGFFLVLWFVVGIYVVPAFLRRARNLINNENPRWSLRSGCASCSSCWPIAPATPRLSVPS